MITKRVRSWSGFQRAIEDVRTQYGSVQFPSTPGVKIANRILFRGQPDARWSLETTLERKSEEQFNVLRYVSLATRGDNEIESFTGHRWNTKRGPELLEDIKTKQQSTWVHLPCYDYLVYLRQHGFPSPLLDWTESPYIAAYFAYVDASEDKSVAVYCYIERIESGKSYVGGAPLIQVMGPYVTTHKRHFAQKSWYTIATQWDASEETHRFCRHELVFEKDDPKQDVLIKIVLPAGGRREALRHLNDYNINHFTLFQSEDALIKAIAVRSFDLDNV